MILTAYTIFHVIISLIAIFAGFVVLFGLLGRNRLDRWTALFLVTTTATSVTGFFFPFHGLTPAYYVGFISLVVLAMASYARYPRRLHGGWRVVYVVGAAMALYLNFFVLIVQSFLKVPALKAIDPTQSGPPFKLTQLVALTFFIVVTIFAALRFRDGASSPGLAGNSPALKRV
jgi:hypothetical protein